MERIILHVYDDESKEFSSLTTYHGMSGMMLFFYHSHPTFFKTTDSLLTEEHLPAVTLCKLGGADQWRNYPVIKSKSELLSSFDAVILGESLDFNDIVNLHRLEDMFMNITGEGLNVRRFLEESRVRCEDFVKSVRIADRQLRNHCEKAEWSLTDYGYCTTFSLWSTSMAHSISIDLKTLLETGDWGDCTRGDGSLVPFYDRADCERDCIVEQFIRRCGCAPFFVESSYVRTCSLVEMGICGRQGKFDIKCKR
nr:Na+ channel domain containing protein [Haemonchus contortus]